jgi:hypothetical protein
MSILLGDCNINIDNYYLTCNDKKYVIKNIANAFTRLRYKNEKIVYKTKSRI